MPRSILAVPARAGARNAGWVIVASLAALMFALLVAAPAAADHKRFRPGVTELPERSGADLAGMREAGVKVLRLNLSWVRVETDRPSGGSCNGSYDWSEYDQLVRDASLYEVRLLPIIVGSPNYVARASTHAPYTRKPREIEPYKCFVRAAVGRYGRGGTLPSAEGVAPITDWQVWNEQNFIQFGTEERERDPREYARLVEVTSRAIRGEDGSATVVLGGMPETTGRHDARTFLRGIYRERGIERKFDAVALHPYAFNHRGVKGAVQRMRRTLRQLRDRGRALWITEVGWATGGNSLPFLVKDRQGQAKQLSKTFKMLRRHRREWKIGTVNWFRWRDTAARSENRDTFDYAGLYSKGGEPKPSCRRFAELSGGICTRLP